MWSLALGKREEEEKRWSLASGNGGARWNDGAGKRKVRELKD